MDIIGELGGQGRRTKPSDESWFKNADSAGMWMMTGGYVSVQFVVDSLRHSVRLGEAVAANKAQSDVPAMPDYQDPGWWQLNDLGHGGYLEYLTYIDPMDSDENIQKFDRWYLVEMAKDLMQKRFFMFITAGFGPYPTALVGPHYGPNFHTWLIRLKEAFDPAGLSMPLAPFDRDVFCDKAEWMHPVKDWETPEIAKRWLGGA